VLTLPTLVKRLTVGAAQVFGLPGGTLRRGAAGDVTVFDAGAAWIVEPERFLSKSRNSPFRGWELRGRVTHTIVGGKVVHEEEVARG
jgi:dihydroorotase